MIQESWQGRLLEDLRRQAVDLYESEPGRVFGRTDPNQLWVTDIERHEALLNRAEVPYWKPVTPTSSRSGMVSLVPGIHHDEGISTSDLARAPHLVHDALEMVDAVGADPYQAHPGPQRSCRTLRPQGAS